MTPAIIKTKSGNLCQNWPRIFPGKANLSFSVPRWNKFAGLAGAYVSESSDGTLEAMAEPIAKGWRFWLVPVADPGNALCMEDVCGS